MPTVGLSQSAFANTISPVQHPEKARTYPTADLMTFAYVGAYHGGRAKLVSLSSNQRLLCCRNRKREKSIGTNKHSRRNQSE